ncbi:TetR/AcrR family transcriptional regulator [Phytohabitans aurantiacus]|jgi:AcrR family transcriptional regulator|uniref:TetR family transcriptional regulator n=1 Tax=Phytohabitans aurantiacus TaxID=3016789 RepID=A0ABQ5QQC9_9ACTN|nr:TetR/AcrR family transcriptional regulator [Phytohabitans aurantiacus]GLH96763.1 TetR family transcriptional regulator [Phytohabitans aurantiacus]
MSPDTPSRRRGQELEDALLTAAWSELMEVGYGRFTIDAVATRAGTSRPVIYRRWPDRAELAIAAVRHHGSQLPVVTPDTGSVREDLLELLHSAATNRADVGVLFGVQMGQYFAETGRTPADLRAELLSGRQQPFGIDEVLRRGVDRGEIDPARLTPRIANLPMDLLRHDLLMTLRPVPDETIAEIVDDIFLPLVRPAPMSSPR